MSTEPASVPRLVYEGTAREPVPTDCLHCKFERTISEHFRKADGTVCIDLADALTHVAETAADIIAMWPEGEHRQALQRWLSEQVASFILHRLTRRQPPSQARN